MKLNLLSGAAALVLLAIAPAPASAQTQPKAPAYLPALPTISDAQFALGKEIVLLTGISKSFEPFIPEMLREMNGNLTRTRPELIADLSVVMKDIIVPEFNKRTSEMVDFAARVVATTMTESELKETAAFLRSPTGKKFTDMQPVVMQGIIGALDSWNRTLSVDMMTRVRVEMKKKGHDL